MSILNFNLAHKISQWLRIKQELQSAPRKMTLNHHIWQETGAVYYLLETLKLEYPSQFGRVCFEAPPLDRLLDLPQWLGRELPPAMAPACYNSNDKILISVCGVSWQRLGKQLRIKAIDRAATLELDALNNGKSRALFQYALTAKHGDSQLYASIFEGKHCYYNLGAADFVQQLQYANASLPAEFKGAVGITKQHFDKPFTDYESRLLGQINPCLG